MVPSRLVSQEMIALEVAAGAATVLARTVDCNSTFCNITEHLIRLNGLRYLTRPLPGASPYCLMYYRFLRLTHLTSRPTCLRLRAYSRIAYYDHQVTELI